MKTTLTILMAMISVGARADSGSDYYIRASDYGSARDAAQIEQIQTDAGIGAAILGRTRPVILDGKSWTINSNLTLRANTEWIIPYGTTLNVATNVMLTLTDARFIAPPFPIFVGRGAVTGNVITACAYHNWWDDQIDIYKLTGGFINDTDSYLTAWTEFTGTITGRWDSLTLAPDVVTSNMLAPSQISRTEVSPGGGVMPVGVATPASHYVAWDSSWGGGYHPDTNNYGALTGESNTWHSVTFPNIPTNTYIVAFHVKFGGTNTVPINPWLQIRSKGTSQPAAVGAQVIVMGLPSAIKFGYIENNNVLVMSGGTNEFEYKIDWYPDYDDGTGDIWDSIRLNINPTYYW